MGSEKGMGGAFHDQGVQDLVDAACRGDAALVAKLVANGVDPNAAGPGGVVPLLWVMSECDSSGAELLLKAGANANVRVRSSEASCPLLTYIARNPNPIYASLLLSYGADPDAACEGASDTALVGAFSLGIETGDWRNYNNILDAGADINKPHLGNTIASTVVAVGRFDKMVELLERGYNHDLQTLADMIQVRQTFNEQQSRDKDEILSALKDRGFSPGSKFESSPED